MCHKIKQLVFLYTYRSTVESYLHRDLESYGIIVWGHFCNVKKLLLLQTRVVRVIYNVSSNDSRKKSLFKVLGILSVPSLYILDYLLYDKINFDDFITNTM